MKSTQIQSEKLSRSSLIVYCEPEIVAALQFGCLMQRVYPDEQVVSLESSQNLLQKLNGFAPTLLLMNLHMQPLNAYMSYRVYRTVYAHIPMVVVTNPNCLKEEIARMERTGFAACVSKPWDHHKLQQLMTEVRSGKETFTLIE